MSTEKETGMYPKLELITPERAKEMLANGKNVRKLSPQWGRYFTALIARDEFVATPDGVCYDVHGVMTNGQHRIWAIAHGDRDVWMWIWYNVPDAVVAATDQGRRRRLADVLGADKRIVDVLSFAIRIAYGPGHVPPGAVTDLMDTEFGEATARLVTHCGGTAKYFSAAPVKTGAIVQMLCGDDEYVLSTYADLVHSRVAALPPVAASFMNQHARGTAAGVATDKYDALARAMVVFDVSKAHLSKIQIGDASKAAAVDAVRMTVRANLGGEWESDT